MSYDKENPKKVGSEFTARASGELEEAVAEELAIEDPSVEEAEAVIEDLTVEEDEVEEVEAEEDEEEEVAAEEDAPAESEESPVRRRGPQD
tara:strand:+ start:926 stop:1198 length:273 start_codon:yes stop_codon:yes gene_type:complete